MGLESLLPEVWNVRSVVELVLVVALFIALRRGWITWKSLVAVARVVQQVRKGNFSAIDAPLVEKRSAAIGGELIKGLLEDNSNNDPSSVTKTIDSAAKEAKGERKTIGRTIGQGLRRIVRRRLGLE